MVIAENKLNATPTWDDHPSHHNLLADGFNNLAPLAALVVNPLDYGLIGNGATHPLSTLYGSLGAAQAAYPFATSLTQEVDWAACQQAVNVASAPLVGGRVVLPPGRPYFGQDTLKIDASYVSLEGAGPRATVIHYAGPSAGVWVQSGTGVSAIGVRLARFGVDCDDVGAYGIKLGAGVAPPTPASAALGLYEQVRVTQATVAGWWVVAAQECLFIGCLSEDNRGDGLLLDSVSPLTNGNTASSWIGGGLRSNDGRGAYIKQQYGWTFSNRVVFETNGQEGMLYERPDNAAVSTSLLVLNDCWFEQNNKERGDAEPYYHFRMVSLGTSLITNTVLRRCYFGDPTLVPSGSTIPVHPDNGHVKLAKGQLEIEYPNFIGALPNRSVVTTSDSTNQLTVLDDGTPDTEYGLGGPGLGTIATPGSANPQFSAQIVRQGRRGWWNNQGGVIAEAANIAVHGSLAHGDGVAVKRWLTGVKSVDMASVNAAEIKALVVTAPLSSGDLSEAGVGNAVRVGVPNPPAGILIGQAYVSATGAVTIPYYNPTGAPIAVGNVTARATVEQY